VPPDDSVALSSALRRLIENSAERRRLAEWAWREAAKLRTWAESAAVFSQAIESVA
jgi:glycosyltransferase involved in cell wall biosynthesis